MVSAVDVAPARMGGILALADRSEVYRELASRLEDRQRVGIAEANAGARAFAWSALVAQNARTVALVAPSEDRARRWRAELAGWLGEDRVLAFPERETMPFEASAPSGTAVHQRLLTLWQFALETAPALAQRLVRAGWDGLSHGDGDEGADLSPYARLVDALREGGYAPGVDAFAPALGATASLLDHLGDRATVVFEDTVELDLAHDALEGQAEERRDELAAQGLPVSVFPPPYVPRSRIDARATEHGSARMGAGPNAVRLGWAGSASYAGRLNEFIAQLATPPAEGVTLIATPQAARLAELRADRDISAVARETVADTPQPGSLVVARVPLAEGFAIPELGLLVFTYAEVFGVRKPRHPGP